MITGDKVVYERVCKVLFCVIFCIINFANAEVLSLGEVLSAIEKNSLDIVNNRANFESSINETKSNLQWEYPFIEGDAGAARDASRWGAEFSAIFVVKPKLWWVNPLLRDSLKAKGVQYQKNYELIRNLNFIGTKRIYLTYIATKEKYQYYLKREENFLQLLSIAKKRLGGGSISRKDYVSFQSAYIDSTLATIAVRNDLLELQRQLYMILGLKEHEFISHFEPDSNSGDFAESNGGNSVNSKVSESIDSKHENYDIHNIMSIKSYNLDSVDTGIESGVDSNILAAKDSKHSDIMIKGLDFMYVEMGENALNERLKNSLYADILDSQAKEFGLLAKYEGRNHWGALELGAGVDYSLSSYNPKVQFSVPLPVTRKQTLLKSKYLSLESGALQKSEITKKQIAIKARAYLNELELQKKYIDIAKNNTEVKGHLAELNRLGYETQQVTLFEYITQANAFVDSQIELVNSQIKYINLVALLEETLGESLTDIKDVK